MLLNTLTDVLREIFSKYKVPYPPTREAILAIIKKAEKDMPKIKKEFDKQFEPDFDLKGFFEAAKQALNESNTNVKFDDNFGMFDEEKTEGQKEKQDAVTKSLMEYSLKKVMLESYFPPDTGNVRGKGAVLLGLGPKDPNEFTEYLEVMFHQNNDDIEPLSGKTYGELKEYYIYKGLEKIKKFYENKATVGKLTDYTNEFPNDVINSIFACECDGSKIEDALKAVGMNVKNNENLKKYMNDFKPYKNLLNGTSLFGSRGLIELNPLYPYASIEDLSIATDLMQAMNIEPYKNHGTVSDQYFGQLFMYDFEKLNKYKGEEPTMIVTNAYDNLKYISMLYGVDVDNLQYYEGSEKLEVTDPTEIGKKLLKGETITVRDENGRFLLNYASDNLNMLKITGADNKFDVVRVAEDVIEEEKQAKLLIGNYKKDRDQAVKDLKDNIKEAQVKITEKVDETIEEHINSKVEWMLTELPEIGKDENTYYSDIVNMLEDIKNKNAEKDGKEMEANDISYHNNKELYIGGLKSVRTICQAYLDEKMGTNLSDEDKEKVKAINSVYTSLLGVENDLMYVNELENKLETELTIKAKADNKEFNMVIEKEAEKQREEIEKAKAAEKKEEKPEINENRKPLFNKGDKDPTQVVINEKVSERKEINKETELNKQMNNNKN